MLQKFTIILGLSLSLGWTATAQDELNTIERAMKDEMERSMRELKSDKLEPPFFIRYRILDGHQMMVSASFGALLHSMEMPSRTKEIRVMAGDYDFNDESLDGNGGFDSNPYPFGYSAFSVPLGDDYLGIRRSLWLTTDAIYKVACKIYKGHKSGLEKDGKSIEEIDHRRFARVPQVQYIEPIKEPPFAKEELEDFVKKASGFFLDYDDLMVSSVRINSVLNTTYFLNSEGTRFRTSSANTRIVFSASIVGADKGVSFESLTYDVLPGDLLPSLEEAKKMVSQLITEMKLNDSAKTFEDSYYGPVMFTGKMVPQLFHNYLISQLTASTTIENENSFYNGGYNRRNARLDDRMGRSVISKELNVSLHPGLEEWEGIPLSGAYNIDDEGVMSPDTLVLIENGTLRNLMTNRTLVKKGQIANGTGSGPGVVHISASETSEYDQLKQKLIELAKKNDQEYAIIIKDAFSFNGWNNLDVYKLNIKTGQEELFIDANISDFSLNNLKRIAGISSKKTVNKIFQSSYISPDALLLEDVGLSSGYQPMKMKEPLVESPLVNN